MTNIFNRHASKVCETLVKLMLFVYLFLHKLFVIYLSLGKNNFFFANFNVNLLNLLKMLIRLKIECYRIVTNVANIIRFDCKISSNQIKKGRVFFFLVIGKIT